MLILTKIRETECETPKFVHGKEKSKPYQLKE